MDDGKKSNLYIPFQIPVQMPGCDLTVKYLERLDESCVEFTHTHLSFEIYHILSGQMRMRIGEHEHVLEPDHFILIPPGVRHGAVYDPDEPKQYVVLVYSLQKSADTQSARQTGEHTFMEQVGSALGNNPCIIARDRNACPPILAELAREAQDKQPGWQVLIVDYCREYFVKLLRNILSDTHQNAAQPDAGQANLAVEITKFMHAHYHENISLEDVSKAFHITPRHVTRIFSDYFGTSFRKTLSIYRLNYAKNYLCTTDKSVEEIARLVGIAAPQTLYRLFRQNEGVTVSEYRKVHRQS